MCDLSGSNLVSCVTCQGVLRCEVIKSVCVCGIDNSGAIISVMCLPFRIPDHSDPKDRMIALVRYYLSSFHAARKGTIAKKPYNPILGETFHCYWDLPNATRVPPNADAKVGLCVKWLVY